MRLYFSENGVEHTCSFCGRTNTNTESYPHTTDSPYPENRKKLTLYRCDVCKALSNGPWGETSDVKLAKGIWWLYDHR